MSADDVIAFYKKMEGLGVEIWIDGGWGVDALLEKQTRTHSDLDFAIEEKDVPRVRRILESEGYANAPRPDTSPWNFVLGDGNGRELDFHVIVFDENGNGVCGPVENNAIFPAGSLKGKGKINGYTVKCITPEHLVEFHTGYTTRDVDFMDVSALCEKFGLDLPEEFRKDVYMAVQTPESIKSLCDAFLEGLKSSLGSNLFGAYIYGAVTFPETEHLGDIDGHVILNNTPSDQEKAAINDMFKILGRDFSPLGVDMDIYFILLDDARGTTPPKHVVVEGVTDKSWALHREHMRAGRCIILHGPDPVDIFPPADWPQLVEALESELKYVEDHLDQYPHYCILNLCRLMYSFETRDVVTSKKASADWASAEFPEWKELIDTALKSYAGETTDQDRERMKSHVHEFYGFGFDKIYQCR